MLLFLLLLLFSVVVFVSLPWDSWKQILIQTLGFGITLLETFLFVFQSIVVMETKSMITVSLMGVCQYWLRWYKCRTGITQYNNNRSLSLFLAHSRSLWFDSLQPLSLLTITLTLAFRVSFRPLALFVTISASEINLTTYNVLNVELWIGLFNFWSIVMRSLRFFPPKIGILAARMNKKNEITWLTYD